MKKIGFDKTFFDGNNKMFVLYKFKKSDRDPKEKSKITFSLKACKYKKR